MLDGDWSTEQHQHHLAPGPAATPSPPTSSPPSPSPRPSFRSSARAPPAASSTSPASSAPSPSTPARLAHLRHQDLRLRRFEGRPQLLHHPPRPRAQGHQHQGQLRPPRLGQDRPGQRRRPHGHRRRRQDQSPARHPPRRRPHRRLLPPGQAHPLVTPQPLPRS